MLQTVDPDDTDAGLSYTILSGPAHGTLRLAGMTTTRFTQADINAGRVTYEHDGSEFSGDSFRFSVADGGEDGTKPGDGHVHHFGAAP